MASRRKLITYSSCCAKHRRKMRWKSFDKPNKNESCGGVWKVFSSAKRAENKKFYEFSIFHPRTKFNVQVGIRVEFLHATHDLLKSRESISQRQKKRKAARARAQFSAACECCLWEQREKMLRARTGWVRKLYWTPKKRRRLDGFDSETYAAIVRVMLLPLSFDLKNGIKDIFCFRVRPEWRSTVITHR